MFLNIITPCSRPKNLHQISKSINIPIKNYRWIVVFDMEELPEPNLIPNNCEYYLHKSLNDRWGNEQRNLALTKIDEGHVHFLDDDTLIHPELWGTIKDLDENDFITFYQSYKDGKIRLKGGVGLFNSDTQTFIVDSKIAKQNMFKINKSCSDGLYNMDCYFMSKKPKKIKKVLAIYNELSDTNHSNSTIMDMLHQKK